MRSGELIGLTWDCIDFENGIIRITKQLVQPRKKGASFSFGTPKNEKGRILTPAPFVMETLQEHKKEQALHRLKIGPVWNDGGFPNLVFTQPDGSHFCQWTVCRILQKKLAEAGIEKHRFHDLRHTYVVNAFRAGDDVKTVQQNAGHYSAAFTLDRYAHVTETMRKESAERMQIFFEAL
ncbi:MAG TPA: site-specific integrase [Desulfovibrio sp.]|nr:site-specific integrase [Desulfovibrio sp.]